MKQLLEGGRDVVIISPHLDDAVFSAFGLLSRQRSVEIVTVFAGIPSPQTPPSDYDFMTESTSPHLRFIDRRVEDAIVARSMGWKINHWNYFDTAYRRAPLDKAPLVADLAATLAGDRDVLVPMGFGSHPDHHITRESSLEASRNRKRGLIFYAEQPYATQYGWPKSVTGRATEYVDIDWIWELTLRHARTCGDLRDAGIVRLDETEAEKKLEAMRRYRTQFPIVENGPSRMLSSPDRIGYEVYWPFIPAGSQSS